MNKDPFEEFEFKPLTEGLGFHKKAEQIKADRDGSRLAHDRVARTIPDRPPVTSSPSPPAKNAGTTFTGTLSAANAMPTPASDSISKIMATLPPSFGSPGLDFLEDAPTKKLTPVPGALAGGVPAAPAYKNAEFQSRLEESFAKAFPKSAVRARGEAELPKEPKGIFGKTRVRANAATIKTPVKTVAGEMLFTRPSSIPSAIVDGLAVLGISVLCLVIILLMTKADLVGLLTNAQTDGAAQLHLGILYVVMLQLYMLVCRSFVGATLGEWSFDTQLGTNEDQQQAAYPLKVVGRTLIMTATAFVLPIVSYLMDRDLLEPITGLALYSHDQDLK